MSAPNKFAICIFADEDLLLTPRRIYKVLPDPTAERSDYIRIIDDEGEDYLYPKNTSFSRLFRKKWKKPCFKQFDGAKFLQMFKQMLKNPILMLM